MRARVIALFLVLFPVTVAVAQSGARGSAINLPLLGRLVGGGNTLYRTALDVSNHSGDPVRVDFYLDGEDLATRAPVTAKGSIGPNATIAAWGTGSPMRRRSNAHFDDFVDALVDAGIVPATLRANGFLGSVLFVFDGREQRGETAVTARFYNALGSGNVGVSFKGHEVTANEPQKLVAAVLDTRGNTAGSPEMYPNLFLNNTGLTADGQASAGPVDIEVSAVSNRTGQAVGVPLTVEDLGPGRTTSIGFVLNALQIAAGTDDTILLYARVVSGNAAIQGVISQVDNVTRDGAVFEMSRADEFP